jgi:hypothetical protein
MFLAPFFLRNPTILIFAGLVFCINVNLAFDKLLALLELGLLYLSLFEILPLILQTFSLDSTTFCQVLDS